jgi:hypothetical protein
MVSAVALILLRISLPVSQMRHRPILYNFSRFDRVEGNGLYLRVSEE